MFDGKMIYYVIALCICFAGISDQRSTPEDDTYVAAVLEYQFIRNTTQNLQNYLKYIQEAATQDVDIIVFPEMTLTRGDKVKVPIHGLLKEYPVPALHPDLYDEILVSISSAARNGGIYVLVNLQEEMDCSDAPGEYCPDDKKYVFNTNVVFDRHGAVIDRYRKINLFGEYTRHAALKPELGLFATDFGVTFGHFICFDLMFQVPATQVVQKHNLTDVIFSTMWFSEMPFLTAIQVQEAYAYAMNINFIAAGANNVKFGTAGSGIYSGSIGALLSTMSGTPSSRLLVARVPKIPGHSTFKYPGPTYDDPTKPDQLQLNKDLTLPSEVSKALVPGFQEFTLTDKGVSCRFKVRTKVEAPESAKTVPQFRAFVKDGVNTYANRTIGVALCGVVACKDHSATSCPYKFGYQEMFTEFEELEIGMTTYSHQFNPTLECDDVVYYPSSLRNNKYPLHPSNMTFVKSTQRCGPRLTTLKLYANSQEYITYKLEAPQRDLVSFNIWGRLYTRDENPIKDVTQEDINSYVEIENLIYGQAEKYTID